MFEGENKLTMFCREPKIGNKTNNVCVHRVINIQQIYLLKYMKAFRKKKIHYTICHCGGMLQARVQSPTHTALEEFTDNSSQLPEQ